jgi:cephalosporin-C deacetylase-like acetyl esterase
MQCTFLLTLLVLVAATLLAQECSGDMPDLSQGWVCRTGDDARWADRDLDDADWQPIEVGKPWEEAGLGEYDGFAWYRLRFRIPESLKDDADFQTYRALKLQLGKIDDVDRTWLNGEIIGETGTFPENYAGAWTALREYRVREELIRWGEDNVLAVRVYDGGGGGGMYEGPYGIGVVSWGDFFSIAIDLGRGDGIFPEEDSFEINAALQNATPRSLTGTLCWQVANDEGAVLLEAVEETSVKTDGTTDGACVFSPETPGFYQVTCIFTPESGDGKVTESMLLGYRPEDIRAPLTRQPDFDAFWANTLSTLAKIDPQFEMIRHADGDTDTHELYTVKMRSLGNIRVAGWYEKPKAEGTFPALLLLPGYSQAMGPTKTSDPIAVLSFNIRGHGNSQEDVSGEPADYWVRGLDDKEAYFYQGAYADCVRAVDFLVSRPEVDESRIAVAGGSQGGGLSLATAALDRRVSLCAPDIPFLCNWEKYFKVTNWPELDQWVEAEPGRSWESLLRTISYFDALNLAGRITCPVFLGLGLQDDVCPAATIFAVYNRLDVPKSYRVYPNAGHWVDPVHQAEKREWLLRNLGSEGVSDGDGT